MRGNYKYNEKHECAEQCCPPDLVDAKVPRTGNYPAYHGVRPALQEIGCFIIPTVCELCQNEKEIMVEHNGIPFMVTCPRCAED